MTVTDFLTAHTLCPSQIPTESCLKGAALAAFSQLM